MKKVVVIPYHVYERMKAQLDSVCVEKKSSKSSFLDTKLNNIHTSNETLEEKNMLYQQELFKFLRGLKDKKQIPLKTSSPIINNNDLAPLPVSNHGPTADVNNKLSPIHASTPISNKNTYAHKLTYDTVTPSVFNSKNSITTPSTPEPLEMTSIDSEVSEALPYRTRSKGMHLYNLIKTRSSEVTWNDIGVIRIHNIAIPGSNIIDIVTDLMTRNTKRPPPLGFMELAPYINKINIPHSLILNQRRREELQNISGLRSNEMQTLPLNISSWKNF